MDNKMTDRELLEAAAKAAGMADAKFASFDGMDIRYGYAEAIWSDLHGAYWNPLVDDSDALRLAVKLGIGTWHYLSTGEVTAEWCPPEAVTEVAKEWYHENKDDHYAATRRAIVRAAAEIGKTQEEITA